MDEQKKKKRDKIINIVVNVVVVVILVVALLVTINNITSKKQGYTSMFGTAYMVVQTESMNAPKPAEYPDALDGFAPGDLLSVKILSDKEKYSLKEGDIISFFVRAYEGNEEVRIINSHRIVKVTPKYDENGNIVDVAFETKGDNNEYKDNYVITANKGASEYYYVIGKVKGNAGPIGHVLNFFNTSNGFLAFIVIPSFLIVIYCAFNLIREILKVKKAGAAADKAKYEEELIARLRAQGIQIPSEMESTAPNEQTPTQAAASETAESKDTK